MPRFIVRERAGHLTGGVGDTRRPPGATFTVLDTAILWRVVGLFRSENEYNVGRGGNAKREVALRQAEEKAAALAARLNDWDAAT